MATLNVIGGTVDINMSSGNTVDHAAQAAPSNSLEYSWTTTSGLLIHAFSFADDITFNATSPLGGTVHALQAVSSYTVGGLVGDLVAMTAAPNNEAYWRTILFGETKIFASGAAGFFGAGDFVQVDDGETLGGSHDVFEGQAPSDGGASTQSFFGDADRVAATATLTGGDDEIHMRAGGDISGDANEVIGTLNGGDDLIVVDAIESAGTAIAGDAIIIPDLEQGIAPSVVGGDDVIKVLQFEPGTISGDIQIAVAPAGISFGGDDLIDASANEASGLLVGDIVNLDGHEVRGGNDTLIGSATHVYTLVGDAHDFSSGSVLRPGADTLIGGNAGDILWGDYFFKGGNTTVVVNAKFTGNDLLRGGGGNDILAGQVGDDTLEGGLGDDTLRGDTGIDTAAFDQLAVAVSVDLELGFAFGQGNDTITEVENVRGSSFDDALGGDGADNRFEGLAGDDQIFGRTGSDVLRGGNGNDLIKGGSGGDTITGGNGADTLNGSSGADIFNYDSVAESTPGAGGRDLIQNFAPGADLIDVSDIDAKAGTGGNQAFAFISAAAFSAEGQIRTTTSGRTHPDPDQHDRRRRCRDGDRLQQYRGSRRDRLRAVAFVGGVAASVTDSLSDGPPRGAANAPRSTREIAQSSCRFLLSARPQRYRQAGGRRQVGLHLHRWCRLLR